MVRSPNLAFGANPIGDQEIDLAQGRMSRDTQVGNKQLESKSVQTPRRNKYEHKLVEKLHQHLYKMHNHNKNPKLAQLHPPVCLAPNVVGTSLVLTT